MAGIARQSVLTLVLLVMLQNPPGAEQPLHRYEFIETHMGSEFKIRLYSLDEATARSASRAAFERIAALDAAFSDYQPESDLMKLCERAGGPPVEVSADLFNILQRSKLMFERSEGAFDVTVGPVVRLWRRARRERKLPAKETIERALSLVSSDFMILDSRTKTVRLAKPGMKLDLGAIAKGYASDAAVKVLKQSGITRCLVAGAGDIVAGDAPPDSTGWSVGIAPLEDPESVPDRTLSLKNGAVSTSGDTERFVEIAGKRYSHIVDSKTGLGKVDRASVTVVAPDGTTADALATAVYALGPDRGLALVENIEGASAYIVRIERKGKVIRESKRFHDLPRVSRDAAKALTSP